MNVHKILSGIIFSGVISVFFLNTAFANDPILIEDQQILEVKPILIQEPLILEPINPELINPEGTGETVDPPVEEMPEEEVKEPTKEQIEEVIKDRREEISTNNNRNTQKSFGILERIKKFFIEYNAVILGLAAVIIAISGFTFAGRKKKRSISKHMNAIDNTYSEYKMKAKRCEAELYRLKDIIDDELKSGKIDDGAYALLMGRIEDYMIDVQKQIVNEKFGGLPGTLKNELFKMMEDGEITDQELETFQKLIGRSEDLSAGDKDSLLAQVKDFKKQDEHLKKRFNRK